MMWEVSRTRRSSGLALERHDLEDAPLVPPPLELRREEQPDQPLFVSNEITNATSSYGDSLTVLSFNIEKAKKIKMPLKLKITKSPKNFRFKQLVFCEILSFSVLVAKNIYRENS